MQEILDATPSWLLDDRWVVHHHWIDPQHPFELCSCSRPVLHLATTLPKERTVPVVRHCIHSTLPRLGALLNALGEDCKTVLHALSCTGRGRERRGIGGEKGRIERVRKKKEKLFSLHIARCNCAWTQWPIPGPKVTFVLGVSVAC